MARLSKISKLPRPIREDLNERLDRNDTAHSILEWLNAVPAVQEMLKVSFNGDLVNKQNITNWRHSGFAAWQLRQDFMDRLEILQDESTDIAPAAEKMADHAAQLLSIHFALLLSPSSGLQSKRSNSEPNPSPPSSKSSANSRTSSKANLRPSASSAVPPPQPPQLPSGPTQPLVPIAQSLKELCTLTRAVVSLRRSDFYAARLKLLLDQSSPKTSTPEQKSLAEQIAEIRSRRYVPPPTSAPAPVPESTQSSAERCETGELTKSKSEPILIAQSSLSVPIAQSSPNDAGSIKINQDISRNNNPPAATPAPAPPRDDFDLATAWVAWMFKTQSVETCRERYAGREQYLPWDMQAALKGGA